MPIHGRLSVLLFLFLTSASPPLAAAEELSVVSHPSKLLLPAGEPVEGSPGTRPGVVVTCNRVHVRGRPRLRHPSKFAHSLKVRVSVAQGDALFRIQTVELCFHRNASIRVGMCPASEWQKLSKSSWVQSMSPYGYRILDIRALPDPSRSFEVSTEEEFVLPRIVFLVLGMVMMAMARSLSESVVFYYGGAMTLGIILVILVVLFQGMKLLPTGRRSSLAIFMYSSVVGVTSFFLHYLSGLLRTVLMEIGISEDMHNPLGIFLLVCLVLAGAWFGYWGVRKLVLTEDGSVDSSVAYFVEWAVYILSAVMIIQSSLDAIFASVALAFAVMISALMRAHGKARVIRHLLRRMMKSYRRTQTQFSPSKYSHAEYSRKSQIQEFESPRLQAKHSKLASCNSPILGLTRTPLQKTFAEENYYSTFHETPERKRFSREEWAASTREHTGKALRELMSSPDFNRWAVANADRIVVTPPGSSNPEKRRRMFRWF